MGNLVGRSLAHFRIVEKLGEGGMGVVYRATDEKLRRQVALKVLPDAVAADEDRRRRFLREARSAAAVMHSNIAAVFDAGEADGQVYIAMELVDGETLRARMQNGLALVESLRIARDMARGLARAHEKGVVHRDLKPENVMITRHGELKILDFGLAKLREDEVANRSALEQQQTATALTREGKVLGTPAYMSPEQARGQDVDARTDVFAFGVVLYEMVTGERPFTGETTQDVLTAVMRDTPRRASVVDPRAPAEMDRVIERCLEKVRDARYANGQELLDAIEGVLPEPPVSHSASLPKGAGAPTVSLLTPGAAALAPRRRAGWRLGLLALAALGLTGFAAVQLLARGAPQVTAPAASPSARAVHAMTEWPPPKTSSPEAAAAYAAGLQSLRDGSMVQGRRNMLHALELDPHLAAAHLRLGLMGSSVEDARQHAASAMQSRALLDPRDQELVTLLRASASPDDGSDAARALARQLPADPEALMWAGRQLWQQGHEEEAIPLLDRALELDTAFAGAAFERANAFNEMGDADRTLAAAERCLAIPPGAPGCLRRRADVHNARGQCAELMVDAQRLVAMEHDSYQNYVYLLGALASQGAPVEALASVAQKAEARVLEGATDAKRLTLSDAARLAVYEGDFPSAERSLLDLAKDDHRDAEENATIGLLKLYGEEGDATKAAGTAETYLRKLPAAPKEWGALSRTRSVALGALRLAGRMSLAESRATRDAWLREWTSLAPTPRDEKLWLVLYAASVATPADATEALAALPGYELDSSYAWWPRAAGAVGRVRALGGDVDGALPLLRTEAAWCGTTSPGGEAAGIEADVLQLQDRLVLGQLLGEKGDRDGACTQYAKILARWGHAKPRSLTADKARAQSKALGCQ